MDIQSRLEDIWDEGYLSLWFAFDDPVNNTLGLGIGQFFFFLLKKLKKKS